MIFVQNIIADFIGTVIGIIIIYPVNEADYYCEYSKYQANGPTLNVKETVEFVTTRWKTD